MRVAHGVYVRGNRVRCFKREIVQPLYALQPSLSAICMHLFKCSQASRRASLWLTSLGLIIIAESGLKSQSSRIMSYRG